MKILLEKIKRLEELEKTANETEKQYEKEPGNIKYEKAFDAAYKAEFDAYINAAKYIEYITSGSIDFLTAKKMLQTKRTELLQLLNI